jgi:hypothetical protein
MNREFPTYNIFTVISCPELQYLWFCKVKTTLSVQKTVSTAGKDKTTALNNI